MAPDDYLNRVRGSGILAAVRRGPAMYVGNLTDGYDLAHLLWELAANPLYEYLTGCAARISIAIGADGSISVDDDGRGLPLTETDGISFADRALTTFHQWPTLDDDAPHEHIGGHGLGLFAVCALSNYGTHTRGFLLGLVSGVRQAAPEACAGKSFQRIEAVLSSGLNAIVCVRCAHPHYESPTRDRLFTPAAKLVVKRCVNSAFRDFLAAEPAFLAHLVSRIG